MSFIYSYYIDYKITQASIQFHHRNSLCLLAKIPNAFILGMPVSVVEAITVPYNH